MKVDGSSENMDLQGMIDEIMRRLDSIRRDADQVQSLINKIDSNISNISLHDIEGLFKDYHDRLEGLLVSPATTIKTAEPPTTFKMDSDARVARVGRRRIPLTEMEFSLLEFLWRQAPKPVSRDALLEHLYPDGAKPSEQVIDVFIFRIRQKLGAAGVNDAKIENVKGTGWTFEVDV